MACLEGLRKHSSALVEQHATCGPALVSLTHTALPLSRERQRRTRLWMRSAQPRGGVCDVSCSRQVDGVGA